MWGEHFWLFGLEFDTFRTFQYLAFMVGGAFFYFKSDKEGITFGHFFLLFLSIVIIGPIGGSLLSMLEFGGSFMGLPDGESGTTFVGGYLLALGLTALMARLLHLNVPKLLDKLTLTLCLGYGVAKLGCFFSGDGCYGIPTDSFVGMTFSKGIIPTVVPVYPTPLFELGYAVVIFGVFYYLSTRLSNADVPAGRIFFGASSWLFLCRFAIEFIRRNPKYAGFTLTQWTCMPLILGYSAGNFYLEKLLSLPVTTISTD